MGNQSSVCQQMSSFKKEESFKCLITMILIEKTGKDMNLPPSTVHNKTIRINQFRLEKFQRLKSQAALDTHTPISQTTPPQELSFINSWWLLMNHGWWRLMNDSWWLLMNEGWWMTWQYRVTSTNATKNKDVSGMDHHTAQTCSAVSILDLFRKKWEPSALDQHIYAIILKHYQWKTTDIHNDCRLSEYINP